VLAKALAANHQCLERLDISVNRIEVEGAVALAHTLASNHSLKELSIYSNNIGTEGVAALADTLLRSKQCLVVLDICFNGIKDREAMELAEALTEDNALQFLNISGKRIGAKEATALAVVLESNQSLRGLDFSCNQIGDRGLVALAEMLRSNSDLKFHCMVFMIVWRRVTMLLVVSCDNIIARWLTWDYQTMIPSFLLGLNVQIFCLLQ